MKTARRPATRFLAAGRAAEMIARKGLAASLEGMAAYIREDFLRWREFQKTSRLASHSDAGVIELMPASDGRLYSLKYVNGHPGNTRLGLSTVMAFGVLADVATGAPTLVSELTLTTALRTAATSAVAALALGRENMRSMALIGNGAQSEFQALAFHELCGVEEFHLFDVDPAATGKLMHNLRRLGLVARRAASASDAVRACDIVTTATADKTRATILTPDMIEPGMHINAIGGDCPGKTELHPGVLEMARVFVEYEPQTRIEGDIQQMPADFPVTELWRVLAGEVAGRQLEQEVTVFDSVGFALEDFSALRYMRDLADELGVHDEIELIPDLAEPKNLFGYLAAACRSTTPIRGLPRAA
ncbi:MAG TPA: ornithine cyclodeaminase [Rhodocyclaceae bacterium]|nr:ornithine cyclodeaminase [Rhodocyclaceae bacterium]